MTISDAQFTAWLRSDAPRVALAEIAFAYELAGAMAEATVYLSDGAFTTGPADSPPHTRYHSTIAKAPEFDRRIEVATLGGRGIVSVSAMQIDNSDGSMDFLLDLITDGREARFYLGARDWPRADFRLVFVAVVGTVRADDDRRITIDFRDKSHLLDDTIIGETIATGPNAGKPRPIALGRVKNFDLSAYLLDSGDLTYYINNFALDASALPAVRDNGVSLEELDWFFMDSGTTTANAGTDTITQPGHALAINDVLSFTGSGSLFAGLTAGTQYWVIAAGFTVDDFRLSLTKGGAAVDITGTVITGSWACARRRFYFDASAATIELSSSPAGRVTVDYAAGDAAGALTLSATPHKVAAYLLDNHTQLEAAEIDAAAFTALDTAELAETALYGRVILDRENLLDLLDEIARSTRSWYAWNAQGVLTAGRLDLANIDAAIAVDEIALADVLKDPAVERLGLQHGKVILDARRNVTVQGDGLAASVSAAGRSKWAQPFQTRVSTTDPGGTTYAANWWDYHRTAIDSRPIPTVLDTGAQVACDAITELFRPWTRVIRVVTGLDKYALNPGDCVRFTYPRYGFGTGKNCRVAGVKTQLSEDRVELTLVTQVTPDYTTAAYP